MTKVVARAIRTWMLSLLVWVGGPAAGWLLIIASVRRFGWFEPVAWVALSVGVVWFFEKRLVVEAQRRRHLREVNEQNRNERERRAAKKALKDRKRAEQRAADLKRRQMKLARSRKRARA